MLCGEGGIRTLGSTTHLWSNESTYENGHEKTSLNIGGCYASNYAQCQAFIVNRADLIGFAPFQFESRNSQEQARLPLHENPRQETGARNLPCLAQGRAQSANGKLSVDAAREVIAQGVSDVFTAANVESLPSASIKAWCETWLEAKAIEAEQSTHDRYKRIVERFTEFLGAKASATFPRCKRATLRGFVITRRKNAHAQRPI